MPLKIPPPPPLSKEFQQLNRWLLEIQSILNNQGTIDPDSVAGLPALFTQVAALASQIAALSASVTAIGAQVVVNTADIATNTADVATNTADIAANVADIVTLTARNQILNGTGVPAVGLGNDGDLYGNDTGGAGTNLYSKRAGAWVAIA